MAIIRLQDHDEKVAGIYYEVDSSSPPIGEGGMGKVYQGKSVNTKTGVVRPVAIKFLFMDLPEQAIERARREAAIHLRNDNLIEMLGFIETDENRDGKIVKHYHVVSELLHGVSLADIIQGSCQAPDGTVVPYAKELLDDFKNKPDQFAKEIIKNVLSGLMALHDAGYIHRDIDPSNIFITDDGHVKLIDFGICKQMKNLSSNDKALTVAGSFMGKPEYASPELALGDLQHQNQTSDIYAVGVLLYQCITGKVPFEGTRFDILDKQVKEKLPLNGIKNKELKRIITKATEKRQELRYQTCAEMRVDLESLDVKRAADPRKRRMAFIIGGLAVIVIAGYIGFSVYRSNVEKNNDGEKTSTPKTEKVVDLRKTPQNPPKSKDEQPKDKEKNTDETLANNDNPKTLVQKEPQSEANSSNATVYLNEAISLLKDLSNYGKPENRKQEYKYNDKTERTNRIKERSAIQSNIAKALKDYADCERNDTTRRNKILKLYNEILNNKILNEGIDKTNGFTTAEAEKLISEYIDEINNLKNLKK